MKEEPKEKDPWPENYLQGEYITEEDYMLGQMVFEFLLEEKEQDEKERINQSFR